MSIETYFLIAMGISGVLFFSLKREAAGDAQFIGMLVVMAALWPITIAGGLGLIAADLRDGAWRLLRGRQ